MGSQDLPTLLELMDKETISTTDIREYFEKARANYPEGTFLETVTPEIRSHLRAMRAVAAREDALKELRQSGGLTPLLLPPCGPVVDLDLETFPTRPRQGTSSGKTSFLMEIVDYSCDRCRYLRAATLAFHQRTQEHVALIFRVIIANGRRTVVPDQPIALTGILAADF